MKKEFKELERHFSPVFDCNYIVGETETGEYYYLWTWKNIEANEIPEDALNEPECMHGAMIGTKEEIIGELEECVGSFRYWGDEEQAEEAQEIVDMMVETLNLKEV